MSRRRSSRPAPASEWTRARRRSDWRPAATARRRVSSGHSGYSAHALHVGGEIADVLRRQAAGDGMHDLGVRTAAALAFVIARIALVGGVFAELLHGVDRMLGPQHRKAGGWIAASYRSVARHAGRNAARAIPDAITPLTS